MAGLPDVAQQSSVPEPTEYHETIVDWLEQGKTLPELAKKLSKGDKAKAKALRRKFRKMADKDPLLRMAIYNRARSGIINAVPGTVEAVRKRAQRGRMDAAKVILEASGVHNPRVQHEHSGEVQVTINMPRPKLGDTLIPDVDVVEES
jgi:hypothetical protein